MTMAKPSGRLRAAGLAAVTLAGIMLIGCQSVREATGAAKSPPDEFTVLTKAPLVIPPDYNLRPPQPGIAARNSTEGDDQTGAAFLPPDPATAAAQLGAAYSESEKLLLTKTNALAVDPGVRRGITSDIGEEDQGPAFAQKLLFQGATPPAAAPAASASATPSVSPKAAPALAAPALAGGTPSVSPQAAPAPAAMP